MAAVGQTSNAVRRLAADREIELALKRGDVDSAARIKSLILEIEKTEELAAALEHMAKARRDAIDDASATGPLKTIPTDLVLGQQGRIEGLIEELEKARQAADEIGYAMDDVFDGIRDRDWLRAFAGLFRVIEQLKVAFSQTGDLAGKIGAVGAVANMAGQAIGGKAGSALSGAGAGAAAGAQLGTMLLPGIGTVVGAIGGAILGGIGGWLGSSKAEKAERNAQALKRAEEELSRARELAAKRADLEIELLEARGQAEAALEARHKATLAALDPSLRALQELIWAEQKLTEERQKAVDVAQTAVDDARARLQEAYDAEASALNNYIDRFRGWSNSLKAFLNSLNRGPAAMLSPEEQYKAARSDFDRVSAAAAAGDEAAIRDLETVSQAYLDASKAYYASSKAYFEDLARVRAAVTATQGYAEAQVSTGEQQLAALNSSVAGILQVNQSVLSVRDALAAYQAAVIALAQAQAAIKPAANDNGVARGADWASYLNTNSDVAAGRYMGAAHTWIATKRGWEAYWPTSDDLFLDGRSSDDRLEPTGGSASAAHLSRKRPEMAAN